MSGHSKWAKIHRAKALVDKQRGNVFAKLGRAITVSVKENGGVTDPEMNFKLRLAIEKARQANMPRANIDKAIANGAGGVGGEDWVTILYEGFGPVGAAVMVEVVTDNRNRALSEIKQIFDKSGGVLGQPGSVGFMFDRLGWFLVDKIGKNSEELVLELMGVEGVVDVEDATDGINVYTDFSEFKFVENKLNRDKFKVLEAELIWKPKQARNFSEVEAEKVQLFFDKLEDSDEVQSVFCDVEM